MPQIITMMCDKQRVSFDDGKCLVNKVFVSTGNIRDKGDGVLAFSVYREDGVTALYEDDSQEEDILMNVLAECIYLVRNDICQTAAEESYEFDSDKPDMIIMTDNKKVVKALRSIALEFKNNRDIGKDDSRLSKDLEALDRLDELDEPTAQRLFNRMFFIKHYNHFNIKVIDLTEKSNVETGASLSRLLSDVYTISGMNDLSYECDTLNEFQERMGDYRDALQQAKLKVEENKEPLAYIIAKNQEVLDVVCGIKHDKHEDHGYHEYDAAVYVASTIQ